MFELFFFTTQTRVELLELHRQEPSIHPPRTERAALRAQLDAEKQQRQSWLTESSAMMKEADRGDLPCPPADAADGTTGCEEVFGDADWWLEWFGGGLGWWLELRL